MHVLSKLCKRDDVVCGVSLPNDIILEVLLRLPGIALRQSRCVCRGWRALISDPAFHAARRSGGRAGPLIVAMFGSAPVLELRLLDDVGNVYGVFNVRGAPALLAPTRLGLIFVDRMQLGARIIDPASGRDFTIVGADDPELPLWYRSSTSNAVSDYSFGCATPSGDYKVLRLHVTCSNWYGRRQRCEVATIMDTCAEPTWRPRLLGPLWETSCLFSCEHKATVNGVLYFLLNINTYSSTSHGRILVAAFDLEREEWNPRKIRGPLLGHKNVLDKWSIVLTELKGTLCMVHNVQHHTDLGGHYANIWLLKDPNTSVWVQQYKIQMPERPLLFTKPLDVLIDGTLLLLNTFQKAGNNEKCHHLQFYNSSTKVFTNFIKMAEGFNGRIAFYTGWPIGICCKPDLISHLEKTS